MKHEQPSALTRIVAENILKYRMDRGLTQIQLMARSGYTALQSLECGKRSITITSLEKIAGALGIPPVALLVDHDPVKD